MTQPWEDRRERPEHEIPFRDTRVGDDETWLIEHPCAEEENINIKGPGAPVVLTPPPKLSLDL